MTIFRKPRLILAGLLLFWHSAATNSGASAYRRIIGAGLNTAPSPFRIVQLSSNLLIPQNGSRHSHHRAWLEWKQVVLPLRWARASRSLMKLLTFTVLLRLC